MKSERERVFEIHYSLRTLVCTCLFGENFIDIPLPRSKIPSLIFSCASSGQNQDLPRVKINIRRVR